MEGREPFDPELLTFNFTDQEIEKFKNKGMSEQEIELLRKTTLNKLERARFDDNKYLFRYPIFCAYTEILRRFAALPGALCR